MKLQAMIDKMMNCTADERQESTGPAYGDYMNSMGTIVFSEWTDWNKIEDFKWIICTIGTTLFVWKQGSGPWINLVYAAKVEIVRTPPILLHQQLLDFRK